MSTENTEDGKTAMITTAQPKVKTALIRSIAFDLSGPAVAFYALRAAGSSVIGASLLAMLVPLGNAVLLYTRRRQLDQVALGTLLASRPLFFAIARPFVTRTWASGSCSTPWSRSCSPTRWPQTSCRPFPGSSTARCSAVSPCSPCSTCGDGNAGTDD